MAVTGIPSRRREGVESTVWQSCHLGGVGQHQAPTLRCIQHVVAVLGRQLSQLFAGRVEGGLSVSLQPHTALLHREQFRINDPALCGIKRLRWLMTQLLKGLMQHCALSETVAETHDFRLLCCVRFSQFRRVANRVEMGDHPPAPAQFLADPLQGRHYCSPAQCLMGFEALAQIRFQCGEVTLKVFKQCRNVEANLLWGNRRVVGKTLALEKGWLAGGGHAALLQPRGRRLWRAIRLWVESVLARASVEAS